MSLSLQQRILTSANDVELLTASVQSLTVDVAEAVAFHKDIVHDDANIKALADRATANAANISTLDATTLSQAGQITTITANVASNAQAIIDYNTQFQQKIDDEEARALAAELVNATAISDEVTRATAAELVNSNLISDEATRALAAELVNTNAISDEVTRATASEAVNATAISDEVARATAEEGALSAAVTAETIRAQAAEVANSSAINAEVIRAEGAEADLSASISAEQTRAINAEDIISSTVSTEQARAEGAEATITSNLAAEVTRATAAELVHTNDIVQLNTDLGAAVTTTTAAIELEEVNRAEADEKMVFTHTLEFDGILSASSYPFCAGNGVPCEPDSAIPIPFSYQLVGVGFCRQSTELGVNIKFDVQHFNENSTVQNELATFTVAGSVKQSLFKVTPVLKQKGFITVKCDTVSGVSDYGRYRVSLYFQSAERFN